MGEHPSSLYVLRAGQVALGTRGIDGEFVAVEVLRPATSSALPAVLLERAEPPGGRGARAVSARLHRRATG